MKISPKRLRFDSRKAQLILSQHLDADDTVFVLRDLESRDTTQYDILFSGNLARQYIPDQPGVDPTANVYTYKMYEKTGNAKVVGPNANDLPRAGVQAGERSINVKQIPAEFGWTVREIQQARKVGVPLDDMSQQAAKRMIDFEQDDMLANGDSTLGIVGLYNIAGVNSFVATDKGGGAKDWTTAADPKLMLADINTLVKSTRAQLKQAGDQSVMFPKFRVILSSNDYGVGIDTPRSDNSDTTILTYAKQNNPWIEDIYEWWRGDTAIAGASAMVCFPPDPAALAGIVPVEMQMLPPQFSGMNINIPCYGSCGGIVCRYAVAVGYMATH